jgi:hypothetical protein
MTQTLDTSKMTKDPVLKRTFKLSVRVARAKREFAEGMGAGVLGTCEVSFELKKSKFESPIFALSLRDQQLALCDEHVTMAYEEVTKDVDPSALAKDALVKRTFKLSVGAARAKEEFAPGMGIGVLGTCEASFELPKSRFESPLFAMSLLDQQKALRDELITLHFEEVTKVEP